MCVYVGFAATCFGSYLSSHCTYVPRLPPTTNSKEELAAAKRAEEEAEAQLAEARAASAQAVSTQSQLQVRCVD